MIPRILFVGGEDHHSRIPFLQSILREGFDVCAAGSGPSEPFEKAGIAFYRFEFDRFIAPFADSRSIRRLAQLLNELQPDLAQGYDAKPCLMLPLAARFAGCETGVIRTLCGRGWVFSPGSLLAKAVRPAYWFLHRIASKSTAGTVFEIESDRDFFERWGLAGRNSVVIPAGGGGVDVDGFVRTLRGSAPREDVRHELGLTTEEIVINVGRMTRQKGIPELLAAASIVHQVRPSVRFLLVGPLDTEGPHAISRDEMEAHRPYVIVTGPRSDVPALMRASDLFAFPTKYSEGVPRVLLEAALAGLPIVATSMPGCRVVVRDGWSGWLVDEASPKLIARTILDALDCPTSHAAVVRRSATYVEREFSLSAIVERHATYYRRLLVGAEGGEPEACPIRSS